MFTPAKTALRLVTSVTPKQNAMHRKKSLGRQ